MFLLTLAYRCLKSFCTLLGGWKNAAKAHTYTLPNLLYNTSHAFSFSRRQFRASAYPLRFIHTSRLQEFSLYQVFTGWLLKKHITRKTHLDTLENSKTEYPLVNTVECDI